MTEIMSEIKRDHMLKLIEEGKRLDGRGVTDVREIKVVTNVIESADGSARVKMGKTEVIAGVKIIPGTPFPDTPDVGVLTTGAELIPMAHPTFESGPPGEDAIELARVVDAVSVSPEWWMSQDCASFPERRSGCASWTYTPSITTATSSMLRTLRPSAHSRARRSPESSTAKERTNPCRSHALPYRSQRSK